jgi:hypothetical protein
LRNGYIHPNFSEWLYGANLFSSSSQNVQAYCNTVEVSAQGGNGIDIIGQNRVLSSGNNFHHNTVVFDGTSGVTGMARDTLGQVNMFTLNRFDANTYHLPNLSQALFFMNDHSWTFAQFQTNGQEPHGTADTNYTGTIPTVAITSPADGSSVTGTVQVQGSAQDGLTDPISKVDLYVDWTFAQTTNTSPFNFSWNTSGVAKGTHTVATMAYDSEAMRACYAVTLTVQ